MNKVKEILERLKKEYKEKHGREWDPEEPGVGKEYARRMKEAMNITLDYEEEEPK